MQAIVEAVIDGYCHHHRFAPPEREHVPDAVRFRPVVIAAREFAASIDTGIPANPAGWWTRHAEAAVVAAYAQQAMERYPYVPWSSRGMFFKPDGMFNVLASTPG